MKSAAIIFAIFFGPMVILLLVGEFDSQEQNHADDAFSVPTFSARATMGRSLFAEHCAACHGAYGEGAVEGPPLVHPMYASDQLSTADFQAAIRHGVIAHRWPFGDMPRIKGLDPEAVEEVYAFVREMQRANDIN